MRTLLRFCCALMRDRKAATAVEYGLICALIVIAIIASIRSLALTTTDLWNNVSTKVQQAQ